MKVYISIDLEGIAGVAHEEQTDPFRSATPADYADARHLMVEEANAAVRGALSAGATRIVVNDSHWHMRSIRAEALHPAAELMTGSPKPWSMVHGVHAGFDAALFVGYHARAGTAAAVIDHTYNDTVYNVRLNDRPVGEIGLNAALAGQWGVPVALVSGDRAACAEARELLGDGVETVIVKEGLGRQAAWGVHPQVARERLESGTARALGRVHQPLVLSAPITLDVDWVKTHHADMAELVPGSTRTAARTVRYVHANMQEVFRAWRAMYNLATVP